ncbi:hypothetical protein I4F81_011112 [Pyropia yezoensis]|uniref:Uncharacterized protein n=1 Tax=Pyropia yezoensis TaxID=2788 RepID=A0ACC3CEL1_PYRYE|nr:hypothetical protein I4F81_011112 [Neopyropia yezoensis]
MGDGESLMTYIRRARTLKAELAGAGNQVGEDTAVMHFLAGLPPAYKTVTTVLLSAGVPLQWDQQLPALLPVEVEQKEAALNFAGEPSVAYSVKNPAGSRASHHMTENSSNWANCISIGVFSVTLANGKTAEAVGTGSLHLTHQTDVPVDLEEVLYVPGLADNLLSVRAETRHGGKINFVGDTSTVHSPTRLVLTGMPNPNNQYEVVVQEAPTAA